MQILDVRTAAEFSGSIVSAIRGGHIPGAVNISILENWSNPPTPEMMAKLQCDVPGGFQLKPTAGLKKIYADLDPNKETIVYCGSGVPQAETSTVFSISGSRIQGVQARLAQSKPDAFRPRGDEVFVNIAAMKRLIFSLQARIDKLEKEFAAQRRRSSCLRYTNHS